MLQDLPILTFRHQTVERRRPIILHPMLNEIQLPPPPPPRFRAPIPRTCNSLTWMVSSRCPDVPSAKPSSGPMEMQSDCQLWEVGMAPCEDTVARHRKHRRRAMQGFHDYHFFSVCLSHSLGGPHSSGQACRTLRKPSASTQHCNKRTSPRMLLLQPRLHQATASM